MGDTTRRWRCLSAARVLHPCGVFGDCLRGEVVSFLQQDTEVTKRQSIILELQTLMGCETHDLYRRALKRVAAQDPEVRSMAP